jgi:uncharacterized protein YbbC (DUF1343 family)
LDDLKLAAELNRNANPGVRFVPVRFTPESSVFTGEVCRGVRILLTDRSVFRTADLGLLLATTLHRMHPDQLALDQMTKLLGDGATLDAIRAGRPQSEIRAFRDRGLAGFLKRREPFLLYPR